MDNWEACKENVLPIKRGRNVKDLNENLEKSVDNTNKNSLDKIQEAYFENNLKSKETEEKTETEKLDIFITRDTYPTNSDKTLKLLEVSYLYIINFVLDIFF